MLRIKIKELNVCFEVKDINYHVFEYVWDDFCLDKKKNIVTLTARVYGNEKKACVFKFKSEVEAELFYLKYKDSEVCKIKKLVKKAVKEEYKKNLACFRWNY